MNGKLNILAAAAALALVTGCSAFRHENTFMEDVRFLRENETYPVVLKNEEGARLALCPRLQGRVMTSTPNGDSGISCGWINYKLIESGRGTPHINAFGGEDRFWIGPEGGQFSFYFPKKAEFTFKNWQVPEVFDTRTWLVTDRSGDTEITLTADFDQEDHSGNRKEIRLERTVRILNAAEAEKRLGITFAKDKIKTAAYTSLNKVTNKGSAAWTKNTGAVSIWILGMFKPSAETVIAIPFSKEGSSPIVKDDYFGKIPEKRLKIDKEKGILYFTADGDSRGKIGLSSERAKGILGSYDPEHNLLTLVTYTKAGSGAEYVNSAWEIQKEPFKGDAVNAYNDGVPERGMAKLGPFYELETSSPAAFLKPGESQVHEHTTFHFTGEKAELDRIALKTLGVSLAEIENKGIKTQDSRKAENKTAKK